MNLFSLFSKVYLWPDASLFDLLVLQKSPEEVDQRSADMWSYAILLWELVTSVQLESKEFSVVDDYVTKENAWRRAVGVVCVLLQSDMIIETGSQNN